MMKLWQLAKSHPYISIFGIILSGSLFAMQYANEAFTLRQNLAPQTKIESVETNSRQEPISDAENEVIALWRM